MKRFKGGPIFLNSGGTGPDDYLVKPIHGGRWTRVIVRSGRNFTGDREAAASDRAAWATILPLEHVCTSDNWRRWNASAGRIPTMNATDYAAAHTALTNPAPGAKVEEGR